MEKYDYPGHQDVCEQHRRKHQGRRGAKVDVLKSVRWGQKTRPSFSEKTKRALADKFPDKHVGGTTKLQFVMVPKKGGGEREAPLYNRTHTVAFRLVRERYHGEIFNKPMKEVVAFLSQKGHAAVGRH